MPNQKKNLPLFFTPTSTPIPSPSTQTAIHCIDSFLTQFKGTAKEIFSAVFTDSDGKLNYCDHAGISQLPTSTQREINSDQLLAPLRTINASRLFLFNIDSILESVDTAGFNDPVQLVGELSGPYPAADPQTVSGQFTVTRGDILEGLVRSAPWAFQYSHLLNSLGKAPRCFHLHLPGSNEKLTQQGQDLVLAYPMLKTALTADSPSNESLTAGLIYDILLALQKDLQSHKIQGHFPSMDIPTPNRALLEARMRAKGFTIDGNMAWRPADRKSLNWLGKLFSGFFREKKYLPPEGTLFDFLQVAEMALDTIPGWPNKRSRDLRQFIQISFIKWIPHKNGGLTLLPWDQGRFVVDQDTIISPFNGFDPRYLCLEIPEEFKPRHNVDLELCIEHSDKSGKFSVLYTPGSASRRDDYETSKTVYLRGTERFRTSTFKLPCASLLGKFWQNADLAIYISGTDDFKIRSIELRTAPSESCPTRQTRKNKQNRGNVVGRRKPRRRDSKIHSKSLVQLKTELVSAIDMRNSGPQLLNHPIVYFDPKMGWAWVNDPQRTANKLREKGFTVLNAHSLREWMQARLRNGAPESVCVMSQDVVPHSVLGRPGKNSLIRKYLNAGGRIVHVGDIPFFYYADKKGKSVCLGCEGQKKVLNIEEALELRGRVKITPEGKEWGIDVEGDPNRCQRIEEITTPLTKVGRYRCESWHKNFNHNYPLSGFVRYFVGGFNPNRSEMRNLIKIAMHGFLAGKDLHRESD